MLSKNLPVTQPARLNGFGHPWHGLVRNGQLELADATIRAYPQPNSGATNLLKPPGAPGGAGLATEPNRQWTDYALLSGEHVQLYQTTLGEGSWVYAAPDGSRWFASPDQLGTYISLDQPLTITVTLKRFGDFGVAEQTHTAQATLADLGQSTPFPNVPSGDTELGHDISSGTFRVQSVASRGQSAILMIAPSWYGVSPTPPFELNVNAPIGALQLDLSGTPGVDLAASLSVLRTRAQMLGTYSDTPVIGITKWFTVENQITNEDFGSYPNCPGHRIQTDHPVWTEHPSQPAEAHYFIVVRVGTATKNSTDRIVNLAFDAADMVHEWTVDGTQTEVFNAPDVTFTSQDRITRFECDDGGITEQQQKVIEIDRTVTSDLSASWSLKLDGVPIVTYTADDSIQSVQHYRPTPAPIENSDVITSTQTVGGPGGGTSSPGKSGQLATGGSIEPVIAYFNETKSVLFSMGYALNQYYCSMSSDVSTLMKQWVQFYSNNLGGVIGYGTYTGDPTSHHAGYGAPGAISNTVVTDPVGATRKNGSWNPATGQVVYAETDPVCWV